MIGEGERLGTQIALSRLRGKQVADAAPSIGTSFFINFHPTHWVRYSLLNSGRRVGGYRTSKSYLLFEGCDWRMSSGERTFRALRLPARSLSALLQRLIGRRLLQARLWGPDLGVALRFEEGLAITVSRGAKGFGQWWVGLPTGGTVDPFGLEEDTRQ